MVIAQRVLRPTAQLVALAPVATEAVTATEVVMVRPTLQAAVATAAAVGGLPVPAAAALGRAGHAPAQRSPTHLHR